VRCGSTEKLHFDHVDPSRQGGGSSPENIQILCEQCNLKRVGQDSLLILARERRAGWHQVSPPAAMVSR